MPRINKNVTLTPVIGKMTGKVGERSFEVGYNEKHRGVKEKMYTHIATFYECNETDEDGYVDEGWRCDVVASGVTFIDSLEGDTRTYDGSAADLREELREEMGDDDEAEGWYECQEQKRRMIGPAIDVLGVVGIVLLIMWAC